MGVFVQAASRSPQPEGQDLAEHRKSSEDNPANTLQIGISTAPNQRSPTPGTQVQEEVMRTSDSVPHPQGTMQGWG